MNTMVLEPIIAVPAVQTNVAAPAARKSTSASAAPREPSRDYVAAEKLAGEVALDLRAIGLHNITIRKNRDTEDIFIQADFRENLLKEPGTPYLKKLSEALCYELFFSSPCRIEIDVAHVCRFRYHRLQAHRAWVRKVCAYLSANGMYADEKSHRVGPKPDFFPLAAFVGKSRLAEDAIGIYGPEPIDELDVADLLVANPAFGVATLRVVERINSAKLRS